MMNNEQLPEEAAHLTTSSVTGSTPGLRKIEEMILDIGARLDSLESDSRAISIAAVGYQNKPKKAANIHSQQCYRCQPFGYNCKELPYYPSMFLTVANTATQMLSAGETPPGHLYRPGEVTGSNTLGLNIGYACKY